jgi:hypothetical protein
MTPSHPADELLLAYLDADLGEAEDASIEAHLRQCDLCVSGLKLMQSRVSGAGEIAVPAVVAARLVFQPQPHAEPRRTARAMSSRRLLLRWPVLVPTSLAAGFLLGAVTALLRSPATPARTTRSVELSGAASVAALDGSLRRDPSDAADVVARLQRGERVSVIEKRADWVRVERAAGEQGWVHSQDLR